ncbi:MAG: pilus assembly protein PilB, partial [Aquincola sp.]|nr:pilus assembly protein PilB [Aquincola sp.]
MSDLSSPPPGVTSGPAPWRWPTPPFAGYPAAKSATGLDIEIEGLTSAVIAATMLDFDVEGGTLRIRVNVTGKEIRLRFEQLRRVVICAPLRAQAPSAADPHAHLLAPPPAADYLIRLTNGGTLQGCSLGHVLVPQGVFLFTPVDEAGSVQRSFVPKSSIAHFEIGPRIGDLLVEQHAATPEQVASAVAEQAELRTRKLGDLLLASRIVEPVELLAAIDQQAKMPVVRIGEALIALDLITDEQLNQALAQQKADRSTPLGELLVKNGHVSRHDLQVALARKMGYPVVDPAAFPIEAEAVRALPFSVARRMQVLPLLLRGTQLVVAMPDPSRRGEIEELEFITQLKVVPALAQGDGLPQTIAETY